MAERITSRSLNEVKETAEQLRIVDGRLSEFFLVGIKEFLDQERNERKRGGEDAKLRELLTAVDSPHEGKVSCLPGTRINILSQLKNWSEDATTSAPQLFWLHGVAGCGKSTVASSIAHSLYEESRLAGSFFCKVGDSDRGSFNSLFSHLAYYIARKHDGFREALLRVISDDKFKLIKSIRHTKTYFNFVFKEPLAALTSIVAEPATPFDIIVIDALDECNDPVFAARSLLQILAKAPWIRMIVTSREPKIKDVFSAAPSMLECDLFHDNHDAHSDILKVLEHEMEPGNRLEIMADDIQGRADAFVEHSQGLFRWVETMISFIEKDRGNIETVNAIIERGKLPEAEAGLDALYRAVVDSAVTGTSMNKRVVQYTIGFIVLSVTHWWIHRHPLSAQFIHALLPPSCSVKQSAVETILDYWSPILMQRGDRIVPVHSSVLDFLSQKERCGHDFWMEPALVHRELACGSLEIMLQGTRNAGRQKDVPSGLRFNICEFDRMYTDMDEASDLDERVERFISSELLYSSLYWVDHIRCGWPDRGKAATGTPEMDETALNDTIAALLQKLFATEKSLFWLEIMILLDSVHIVSLALALSGHSEVVSCSVLEPSPTEIVCVQVSHVYLTSDT